MIKNGTLVSVKAPLRGADQAAAKDHGTLWVATASNDDDLWFCKSLATGFRYPWFDWQIETHKEKEQTNGTEG